MNKCCWRRRFSSRILTYKIFKNVKHIRSVDEDTEYQKAFIKLGWLQIRDGLINILSRGHYEGQAAPDYIFSDKWPY